MSDLVGQPAELHMTIQVTRKETGKVEEFQLVGYCSESEAEELGATKVEKTEKE
jgi:hypothetical protein